MASVTAVFGFASKEDMVFMRMLLFYASSTFEQRSGGREMVLIASQTL
jgi:hypothetical protein